MRCGERLRNPKFLPCCLQPSLQISSIIMNIDYNSEESFNVSFSGYNTTIERILSLKTTDFQNKKPGEFFIDDSIDWNHATLGAFLDVLYYFKERRIQWEEFSLYFRAEYQSFTSVLLQTVNCLNIFKKMDLALWSDARDEYSADCEYFFPGINQNEQLESLKVHIYGSNRFEDDFTTLASHLREMTALKELELWGMVHFNEQLFCESIGENESLQKLDLGFRHCNGIVMALPMKEFPTSSRLWLLIVTENQFGELSSKAIEMLLSKTRTLSKLVLNNKSDNGVLNAEFIVQGLKKNKSLKSLSTENSLYGDLMLSRFFQILPYCPNLERLSLCENDVTKSDLEQVSHMERLQKPITLQIGNDPVNEYTSVMTKLLRCHPEIRLKNYIPYSASIELQHVVNLNWNGRYLIDRSTASLPLSLWPLVFERVKKKPSVIYEFLKGPCFAAK